MPNADTTAMRNKARRVKDLAITRAIYVLENEDKVTKEQYNETYQTVLKNSVPRTQEITGEDGSTFTVHIAKEVAVKNEINEPHTSPSPDSEGQS